jgi:ABC-type proline/glycine betaine transport system ATPase subunit
MRQLWHGATLLYVTHNVSEALAFERVLLIVVEAGKIVEDGIPQELLVGEDSRFRALYESDIAIRTGFMSSEFWRRLEMRRGRLIEKHKNKTLLGDQGRPSLAQYRERRLESRTRTGS